jgi:hypothetical protein
MGGSNHPLSPQWHGGGELTPMIRSYSWWQLEI